MTLEDFFTSTEMKNGLSAPDRVKELVDLMRKGTDCVNNNVSDATRQCSAVARAIAGTENKGCLLLFVELDGLIYMNKWLTDASNFGNKTSDSSVENIIIGLLRAFTRIETDRDKLVTSGFLMTVNDLLGHNNPKVRDMAKSLLQMWNKGKPRKSIMETEDIDASKGSLTSEIHQDIAKDALLSTASESLKDEEIEKTSSDIFISNEDTSYSTSNRSFPDPVNANLDKLEPPVCSEEPPSAELDPTRTEELTQEMCRSSLMLDEKQDAEPCDVEDVNAEEEDSASEDSDYDEVDEGYLTKDYDFSKQNNRKKDDSVEMKSDFDLDYGMGDPLELARLVANEVEREVEDRSEPSCSSSDKETSSKSAVIAVNSAAEVSTQPDISLDPPTKEGQVIEAASTDEFLGQFDLNEDVCLENVERQGDTTSHIVSIVSASKVAAAPLMPVGPLQFEGALGWKGSAATSAFRPASPRRVPESSSRGNHNLFDLNLAESRDNERMHVSSAEASSRRSGTLEFDLNQISDDGLPPEQYPFHHNQSYSQSATGCEKANGSVISIMGKRVEVNRRDSSVKHVPSSNGRIPGPSIGLNLERREGLFGMGPPASYPHPHMFSPNGLPPGFSVPFSSHMYASGGTIPHMGDLRESPVIPQFLSSSTISTAFPQPPYPFSMHEMPNGNGLELSRDGFYLNSGMYTEGSGRELGGFRQLFNPQPRQFDEHPKANTQPSTNLGIGVGGKRKEPENGWESYPVTHHHQSWR